MSGLREYIVASPPPWGRREGAGKREGEGKRDQREVNGRRREIEGKGEEGKGP